MLSTDFPKGQEKWEWPTPGGVEDARACQEKCISKRNVEKRLNILTNFFQAIEKLELKLQRFVGP
jgi:hypothetical protein